MAAKPLIIVGGGLAGLTLGIGLRQRGVPVTLCEAGHYPRHRVCGEFISGRGQDTLNRLGLAKLLARAGATQASTAAFFSETQASRSRPLPVGALCVSRFALDQALADHFRELGGELREGQRFTEDFGEGIVRAMGRRAKPEVKGSRWFGLKAHARNLTLTADLEMHVSAQGYVGLCRLAADEVNICGLFRRRAGEEVSPQNWRTLLSGPAGSHLQQRLASAEFDETSFCAVAGLSLSPEQAVARTELCVGDAITMIPPVTGNGMSMAFESAELALEPLAAWSRGQLSWEAARTTTSRDCDSVFADRLRWAKWLQRGILTPALQKPLVALAARSDWFWRAAFERTR